MSYTLGEIAKISGAELDGDPHHKITRVSSLQDAKAGEISFLANKRYARYLDITEASAVILATEYKDRCPVARYLPAAAIEPPEEATEPPKAATEPPKAATEPLVPWRRRLRLITGTCGALGLRGLA